ncbi:hypothetical protein LX15_005630 [Streptoalloteichus tenebrarius]|uniref:Zinc ribbon domain-containing protein n=3 Tax=Streptoalloteichus tenebrarius (strain ATCC 17920 / DSM 40477 / JCM 4838 / CBS 697.72 / NBRC 16177 / NCIMB 11028 / NRRL B-12390 / A12253. 1 / ISP 5477) TaxID=1933 RepID=A0ABT1I289_STRSD|nr:hypothetical protein [Streptoalloteichus tenebrarius]BFF01035.1 hypothetical protein GCM10020241_27100 [Streptoalloteichus tenebrarius]
MCHRGEIMHIWGLAIVQTGTARVRLLGMANPEHPRGALRRALRLFPRRRRDDLLERSLRPCGGCGEQVHVFAETCRHCGHTLDLVATV